MKNGTGQLILNRNNSPPSVIEGLHSPRQSLWKLSHPEFPGKKDRSRSRGLEELLDQSVEEGIVSGPHWSQDVHQSLFTESTGEFWNQPTAMVSVEIDMPENFAGAMKRRAVEVSERHRSPEELQQFQAAKDAEVNNFIAARAFEAPAIFV